MRFWPDSLAARTLVLLLGTSLILVIGSAILLHDERQQQFDRQNQFQFVKRITTLVKLIVDTDQKEQLRIIEKYSASGDHISIEKKPLVDESPRHPMEFMLKRKLQNNLKLDDQATVYVKLNIKEKQPHPKQQYLKQHNSANIESVLISIRLAKSSWLNISTENYQSPPPWAGKTLQLLTLLIFSLVVSSYFIARRLSQPLIKLGQAAEGLGLGHAQTTLPETGPKEVRQTIHAFNLMQERVKKQIEDRSLMLAAVSHDLRTPITTLRLRAEYIEDEEIRTKTLATLSEMEAILNTTLGFARDEAADENTRKTDLAALIQSLVDDHEDLGSEITYAGPDKITYTCRPVSLRRAVNNLIENALRYGHKAEVHLHESDKEILIIVKDYGLGIPADQLTEVFTPFYRLEESRNKSTGGTGLGLAVAKSIVLAHGGELTLSNRTEGGLQATVSLPKQ